MNSCRSIEFCGVHAAVDDVHHRHRQRRRLVAAEVAEERHARRRRRPPSRRRARRRGSRWRRAGPCSACRRARSARGRARSWSLASRPRTASAISPFDVARRPSSTPLPPYGVAAVAQLDRLVHAGRGARRHGGAAEGARLELDVDLDRRVAARVEDLAGVDVRRSGSFGCLLRVVEVAVLLARAAARSNPRRRAAASRSASSTRRAEALASRGAARAPDRRSSRRATFTAAKSTSPSSADRDRARLGAALAELASARAARRRGRRARPSTSGYSKPTAAARRCTLRA